MHIRHLFLIAVALLAGKPLAFAQNIVLQKHLEYKIPESFSTASLFVKGNGPLLRQYVKQIGGTYKYHFKNFHHITIPGNRMAELAAQPFVTYIDYGLQHPVALNDSMRVKTRINQVQQGLLPLPKGYTGKNILVGFIDDGVDFNHPDFKDSSGHTRVIAIWDQSQPFDAARTPAAYGYGQVWDSTDINNGICTSQDLSGHGTTVAGTASGNGLSTGTHRGAAPQSYVVMVKTTYSQPDWLATVADAVDYMYKLADSLNMPCVINASVGDYYGSHDGKDIASQYIDSMVRAKRGRLMVSALGNSGEMPPYHLETTVTADTSFTWFKYNPPGGGGAFPYGVVFFEAFADTADFKNVQFSVGADRVTPVFKHRGQSPFRRAVDFLGGTITDTIFSPAGNRLGIVDYYAEFQGDLAVLQVHIKQPDSSAYYFRFSTTGSGRFDVWSADWLGISDMVNTGPPVAVFPDMAHYISPDSAKTMVSAFQCLESVVTVGNYNNIQNYIGYDGNPVALGEAEGAIAVSSSRGPTRDNRQKPDVAATGNVTFSPGPLPILNALITSGPFKLLPDGMHMRNGGTSMASPVVAGIGALMLERCPQLNWAEFKTHINTSAYTDGFTGAVPNISFGYGKADAFAAIAQTVFTPVIIGDTAFCAGESVLLQGPLGYTSYTWSAGDTTQSILLDTTAQVWLSGTSTAACPSDTAYATITQNPLPVVSIGLTGVVLTANAPGTVNWQWYYNGGVLTGETANVHTAINDGNYYAAATDANGCTGYSDTLLVNSTGLNENATDGMMIFPNPFDDYVSVTIPQNATIVIRNALGEMVLQAKEHTMNTSRLKPGMYTATVYAEGKTNTFKLVKL